MQAVPARVGNRVVDLSVGPGDLVRVVDAYGKRVQGTGDVDRSHLPRAIQEPMAPGGVLVITGHVAVVVDALRKGSERAGNVEEGEGPLVVHESALTIRPRHQPGVADAPGPGEGAAWAIDRGVYPPAQEKRVRNDSGKPVVAHHLAAVID